MESIKGLETVGIDINKYGELFGTDSQELLVELHRRYGELRRELLRDREREQERIDSGGEIDFLSSSVEIRESVWEVQERPRELWDRRVEITGPADDRKMVINALNSGAKLYMSCLEDACAPRIENLLNGQINLRDALSGTIEYRDEKSGKEYRLSDSPAVLKMRPRGLHLEERHLKIDSQAISGTFFDLGIYISNNVQRVKERGSGIYLYLAKLESHKEARMLSDLFAYCEERYGLPRGSIKVTVLIETLPAAFQAEEILYELKENIDGLNCGRWDYIFSYIKAQKNRKESVLPDRQDVTMAVPFMRNYCLHVLRVCHKRGAHAIGGMAAQIPIKNDDESNNKAFEKVRIDKTREAKDGFDGSWVAHPGLVSLVDEIFTKEMSSSPHQLHKSLPDTPVSARDLLESYEGKQSRQGLLLNIDVGLRYLSAWLGGYGAVPLYNLMEDVATAEISRSQLWQWKRHNIVLDDGQQVTNDLLREELQKSLDKILKEENLPFAKEIYKSAHHILEDLCISDDLKSFLTIDAYNKFHAPQN